MRHHSRPSLDEQNPFSLTREASRQISCFTLANCTLKELSLHVPDEVVSAQAPPSAPWDEAAAPWPNHVLSSSSLASSSSCSSSSSTHHGLFFESSSSMFSPSSSSSSLSSLATKNVDHFPGSPSSSSSTL